MLERFLSAQRLVLVADRRLLSLDHLEALKAVRLASDEPLEFIDAAPGRGYSEFGELLEPFYEQRHHRPPRKCDRGAPLERAAAGGRARSNGFGHQGRAAQCASRPLSR